MVLSIELLEEKIAPMGLSGVSNVSDGTKSVGTKASVTGRDGTDTRGDDVREILPVI